MTHRTYRLSISPEGAPEIRRVCDFDGRSSLADVHQVIWDTLITDDDDHLYVFFLSGRYWDKASEYVDPRTEGPRADKALLFRLNLKVGRRFVYVFDYGDELRHELTVVSVTDVAVPLEEPVLVESVGEPQPTHPDKDEDEDDDNDDAREEPPDAAFAALVALAERVLAPKEPMGELDDSDQELSGEKLELVREALRAAGTAALELGQALQEDLVLLGRLTDWLGDDRLIDDLLHLPSALSFVGEFDRALAVAGAFLFMAREKLSGDMAIFDARAGRREAALARVAQNLETATDACLAEAKAGDAYRALGEWDAAEAYYRRSVAVAKSPMDRAEGVLRISSLLIDTGREAEADAFMIEERRHLKANRPSASTAFAPSALFASAGRNDPCPCGSGKKYKKCHGASA